MLFRLIVFCAILCLLPACRPAGPEVEYFVSESTRAMHLPFSDAVRVGNMLYVSGQIGVLPGTKTLATGGLAAEAKQSIEKYATVWKKQADGSWKVPVDIFNSDLSM